MGNHVHEMFFIESPEGFSAHMRRHHSRFGFMFNKAHKRCGKVARDRAKTILIENDSHAMQACFYIHANPIKHGFVKDLRQYPYTSHDLYAYGKRNEYNKHVELPSWYQRLGKTVEQRQRKYRRLFQLFLKEQGYLKVFVGKRGLFDGDELWRLKKVREVEKFLKSKVRVDAAKSVDEAKIRGRPPPLSSSQVGF